MKKAVTWVLVALWLPFVLVTVGLLMVGHTVAMPMSSDRALITRTVASLSQQPDSVVHFIPADCSCTDGLVRHLAARSARPQLDELVVFVGQPDPHHLALGDKGYRTDTWSAETLFERTGLEAGPVIAIQQAGTTRYLGGYFEFPAAVRSLDESLIDDVSHGDSPAALPLFGCAVSDALRRSVDPLGVTR